MENSIKVDSVFLNFRENQILRGANVEFVHSNTTGILGRNGCGKSCLLKVIIGQINPQSKHINYNGKQIFDLYKKKGLINYLPQHEFHPRSLSLKQLLNYYGIKQQYFLKNYPFLEKDVYKRISFLSGGERRLIEVLLVLESKSKFSILDEPFSHIMPKYIDMVKNRINELKAVKGIILTDHQYRNVVEISDQLYLLTDGVIKSIDREDDLQKFGYIR